ncbi:MAG: murein biosynthesis integral membrane protein MurJ [Halanaerobiaceae bacterium]|nr:murein biosynthesis integral membrane protein MurJ [Halanaerobiaceae bacterium]
MKKSHKTARSALMIMIFTLGSKLLGFIRETLIASKFGSGMLTDAFFIAVSATTLVGSFILSSISTTFIPVISEVEAREGRGGKIKHTNNIINITAALSLALVIIALAGTPLIVRILASGFEGEQFNLAVNLTRIGLPIILFSGLIGVLKGFLESEQRFYATAIIGIPFNLAYIFYLVFMSSLFGIKGLMVTAVIAVFTQLLVQIPELIKAGFRYKFIFDFKDNYINKVLYLSLPVLLGTAINDLNVIIDKTLASRLVSGSISALNYANKLNGLLLGVFISAIATVVFPLLAKEFSNNNITGVKRIMSYGVILILLITIPATVGLAVLATPIVQVAFERGAFNPNDTIMTSSALIFYSLGLVASALRLLITRVYYSLQDTRTPMINGVISLGLNIILNLIFIQFMAHTGLACATSISNTVTTLLLFYVLKKKIGSLGTWGYIRNFIKAGLASVLMGVIVYTVYHGLYGLLGVSKLLDLLSLLAAVGTGVIVYSVLCYVFGIEEVKELIGKIRDRVLRGTGI